MRLPIEVRNLLLTLVVLTLTLSSQCSGGREERRRRGRATASDCSTATCRLPACHCAGEGAPLNGVRRQDVPQFVMVTFDDAVTNAVYEAYMALLSTDARNPNGCPPTLTFFVSHEWTNYSKVRDLYARGHEMASHSITHRMPQSWWATATAADWKWEIAGERDKLVTEGGVRAQDVWGVRAPFLDTGGDVQFSMMSAEGFRYDASFMAGPRAGGGLWPFTLDTAPQAGSHCDNINCPRSPHPGLWEVPLNRWTDKDGNKCAMVDSCLSSIDSYDDTLDHLRRNFRRHYEGNRAPLLVSSHGVWVGDNKDRLRAYQDFMSELLALPDVYLVSVQQMLGWMANPLPAAQTKTQWVPCRSASSSSPSAGRGGGGSKSQAPSSSSGAGVAIATPAVTAAGAAAGQPRSRPQSLPGGAGRKASELMTSVNITSSASRNEDGSSRQASNNNDAVIFAAPNDTAAAASAAAQPPQHHSPSNQQIPGSGSGAADGEGGVPERLPEIYPDAQLIASLQAMDERRRNGHLAGAPPVPSQPLPGADAAESRGGGGGEEGQQQQQQQHGPLDDGTLSVAREGSSDVDTPVSNDKASHTAQHAKSSASGSLMEVGMMFVVATICWILA